MGAAGGSFGGYMVNWIAGHSTRFKALVSHAGPFNLENMYAATEELWFPEWEYGGPFWDPKAMREQYRVYSPHLYAGKFKTPTLVTARRARLSRAVYGRAVDVHVAPAAGRSEPARRVPRRRALDREAAESAIVVGRGARLADQVPGFEDRQLTRTTIYQFSSFLFRSRSAARTAGSIRPTTRRTAAPRGRADAPRSTRTRRLLADVAVPDHALARRRAGGVEHALQRCARLERAAIVDQRVERHVPRARDVSLTRVHAFRFAGVEALIARIDDRRLARRRSPREPPSHRR